MSSREKDKGARSLDTKQESTEVSQGEQPTSRSAEVSTSLPEIPKVSNTATDKPSTLQSGKGKPTTPKTEAAKPPTPPLAGENQPTIDQQYDEPEKHRTAKSEINLPTRTVVSDETNQSTDKPSFTTESTDEQSSDQSLTLSELYIVMSWETISRFGPLVKRLTPLLEMTESLTRLAAMIESLSSVVEIVNPLKRLVALMGPLNRILAADESLPPTEGTHEPPSAAEGNSEPTTEAGASDADVARIMETYDPSTGMVDINIPIFRTPATFKQPAEVVNLDTITVLMRMSEPLTNFAVLSEPLTRAVAMAEPLKEIVAMEESLTRMAPLVNRLTRMVANYEFSSLTLKNKPASLYDELTRTMSSYKTFTSVVATDKPLIRCASLSSSSSGLVTHLGTSSKTTVEMKHIENTLAQMSNVLEPSTRMAASAKQIILMVPMVEPLSRILTLIEPLTRLAAMVEALTHMVARYEQSSSGDYY